MRTFGNIIWHVPFLGFVNAIAAFLLGVILVLTVVAAPIGFGLLQYSKFLLLPFGNAMVNRADLSPKQNPLWRAYSTIVMLLYLPFGLLLTLFAVLQVVALFVSIIGIPVGLVVAKSLGTYLNPVNKVCVPSSVLTELERRKAEAFLAKRATD